MKWLITFFLLSAMLFGVVAYIVIGLGPEHDQTIVRLKKKWTSQTLDNIKHVILGNSRALALNIDNSIPKTLNLSIGGLSVPVAYYVLREFSANNPDIEMYYIEFAPDLGIGSFQQFLLWYADDEMVKEMALFEPEILTHYENLNFISRRFYPLHRFHAKYMAIRAGITNSYYRTFMENTNGAYIFGSETVKIEDRNQILYYPKSCRINPLSEIPAWHLYYFDKLTQLISERNLNVKFFLSPVPAMCMPLYSDPNLTNSVKNLKHLLQMLLEYNEIPQWYMPDEYFVEGSHLQYQYAPLYTEYFRTCIMSNNCTVYKNNIIQLQYFLESIQTSNK